MRYLHLEMIKKYSIFQQKYNKIGKSKLKEEYMEKANLVWYYLFILILIIIHNIVITSSMIIYVFKIVKYNLYKIIEKEYSISKQLTNLHYLWY